MGFDQKRKRAGRRTMSAIAGLVAAATLVSPLVAYAGTGGAGSGSGSGSGDGTADGTTVPMMDLPVWSMCWELLFSLLLPLYVLLARDVRVVVPSMLAIMVFAQWSGWLPLQHMAVFAIGVALAYHHVSGRGVDLRGGWSVIACLACVAMMVQSGFGLLPSCLSEPLGVAGAAGLVYVATGDNVVSRLLSCRPLTHLGAISFSLYLTHLPVRDLVGQFIQVPGRGLVLMLAVAEVFYRLVEKPSTVLSHRVRESCMLLR